MTIDLAEAGQCPYLATLSTPAEVTAAPDAVHACVEIVHTLYADIDAGRASDAAVLFTHHAIFEAPTARHEGIGAIAGFLAARQANTERRSLHVLANLRATQLRDDVVAINALTMVYVPGPDDGPLWVIQGAANVRHVLRRVEHRWLIAARLRTTAGGGGMAG
jgi:hypothetical protein